MRSWGWHDGILFAEKTTVLLLFLFQRFQRQTTFLFRWTSAVQQWWFILPATACSIRFWLSLSLNPYVTHDALFVEIVATFEDNKVLQQGILLLSRCVYLPLLLGSPFLSYLNTCLFLYLCVDFREERVLLLLKFLRHQIFVLLLNPPNIHVELVRWK